MILDNSSVDRFRHSHSSVSFEVSLFPEAEAHLVPRRRGNTLIRSPLSCSSRTRSSSHRRDLSRLVKNVPLGSCNWSMWSVPEAASQCTFQKLNRIVFCRDNRSDSMKKRNPSTKSLSRSHLKLPFSTCFASTCYSDCDKHFLPPFRRSRCSSCSLTMKFSQASLTASLSSFSSTDCHSVDAIAVA